MSDWKELTKSVLNGNPPELKVSSPLERVLDVFVELLNESEWVAARKVMGSFPSLRSLVVSPKYRRDEGSIMLTFMFNEQGVTVLGAETTRLTTTEEFQEYLGKFATESHFPATVALFRELGEGPVLGQLSVRKRKSTSELGLIELTAEDLKRLVLARRGEHLNIGVKILADMGNLTFSKLKKYQFLDAKGALFEINSYRLNGNETGLELDLTKLNDQD